MARRRRQWKPKEEPAKQWKPKEEPAKEASQYKTLLDLVLGEDIYLVNYYGFVCQLRYTFPDHLQDGLKLVGQNAIGILFGGCLVVLPASVAVKNLGYLRPVGVPRGEPLVTEKGTHVYDLRKDLQGLYGGEWSEVSFDQAARDFWDIVGEHRFPKWNKTFFKFLMLDTGVDLCETEE